MGSTVDSDFNAELFTHVHGGPAAAYHKGRNTAIYILHKVSKNAASICIMQNKMVQKAVLVFWRVIWIMVSTFIEPPALLRYN